MKTTWFLGVGLLFLASSSDAQNLPPRVSQALRVLPPGSETLAVEQMAHLIPVSARKKPGEQNRSLGLLSNLQSSVVFPYLAGRTVELSMEARSRFRAPKGFGLMPYDGCGLLYLKPQTGIKRGELEVKLLHPAKQRLTIGGQRVGVFEEKREYDLWRIYVAVPQDNLVVLATDRKSLETTLARMKKVATLRDRAFPAAWSGWKLVDTKAAFWAVRRLDFPESIGIPEGRTKDTTAKAFVVFSRGDAKAPSYVMRYEGDQKFARRLFTGISRELPGQFKAASNSAVSEFLVPNSSEGYFSFYALGLLGTGIFL